MSGIGIADIPPLVAARERIEMARLLVAGMLQLKDVGALAKARGQLLRAALLLDGPAASLHPFAGAYVDGAAQAREAAKVLGASIVALRRRLDGEPAPADAPVIEAAMRRLSTALSYIEASRVWAYAGTHP